MAGEENGHVNCNYLKNDSGDIKCVSYTYRDFDVKNVAVGSTEKICERKPDVCAQTEHKSLTRKFRIYLYISHFLSVWGDRMWSFGVGVFLIKLSPESLRLTATFGFSTGTAVLLFGALIGDWVDNTPRLKAAKRSLLTQNVIVCANAVVVFFAFNYKDSITSLWPNGGLMNLCHVAIIVAAIISKLSSVALTIAVQRDWIVEICGKNKERLSSMNATLRTIQLTAHICAPGVTGQILSFTAVSYSIAIIAGWNVLSGLVEYYFIRKVYNEVPALRHKHHRRKESKEVVKNPDIESSTQDYYVKTVESPELSNTPEQPTDNYRETTGSQDNIIISTSLTNAPKKKSATLCFMRVFDVFITVFRGWRTFMKYDVAFAGLGLACLFMSVFGFDSVSVGYAYSQGISEAIFGALQVVGGVIGIIGTLAFPRLRMKMGLKRTGLLGLGFQLFCLCLCVASVWIPNSPFDLTASSDGGDMNNICSNTSVTQMPTKNNEFTSENVNASLPQVLNVSNTANVECSPVTESQTPDLSIWFFMMGVVTSRFGLWVADLATTELFLQSVDVKERGIVSGVQTSLIKFMGMLKFLIVIILPSPSEFGLLVLISFFFSVLGVVLYMRYSGEMPHQHVMKLFKRLDAKNNNLAISKPKIKKHSSVIATNMRDVSVHL